MLSITSIFTQNDTEVRYLNQTENFSLSCLSDSYFILIRMVFYGIMVVSGDMKHFFLYFIAINKIYTRAAQIG